MSLAPNMSVIVIGASAGGVEVLRTIISSLPRTFDAAVFVTLHIGANASELPRILGHLDTLPVSHAVQGESIRPGQVYVAPPDHHLTIEWNRVVLTKGPRENMARPAIDPMFRSAARVYGDRVIGVILTGGLNDGTAGLIEVKARGGIAIVQEPDEAHSKSMPASAITHVVVDHVLPAAKIGACLIQLVELARGRAPAEGVALAIGDSQERGMTAEFTLNRPVAVTCPDCGGALRRSQLGSLTQFSCHIGHVYTAEVMLASQFLVMERFVEQAMRSLSERAEMCRLVAKGIADIGGKSADDWEAARREALDQTQPLRDLLTRSWLHPEGIDR